MNFETEINQIHMSSSQITHVMKEYIPVKLRNCVKLPPGLEENVLSAEELVQFMLSNSDNMLRMYGTARELLLNLKKYQNFPLNHRCFGFDPKEPYTTFPIVYENMDGVPFVNKADLYCFLQNTIKEDLLGSQKSSFELFRSMQCLLLKSYEHNLREVCEFFKYDKDLFIKLQDELLGRESSTVCEDWNFEKALETLKWFPSGCNHHKHEFERDLKRFFESKSGNFHDVNLAIHSFADCLTKWTAKYPEMFRPYDIEKNPNCPIVVRVFDSHGVQFVMKSELFNAINIRNPNSKLLECKVVDGKLMTMDYEKVQRKYKDRIENIEFIKCPIQRTDHKAVPIITPSGDHCILAVDFLFEILNELIFTHRIFQKISSENRNVLRRFFLQMTNFFSPHHKSIFFVTVEEQDKQKEELMKLWEKFEPIPAKYVRNAKKDGFTVQNLKNELVNLGLLELFPEIQDYAEAVYSEVFKAKNKEFLRTCDLFKAVEKCLLHCIFKRFPTLPLFLHTQNACHLLPNLRCDFCISPNTNQFKNITWIEPPYMKTSSTFMIEDPENTYLYQVFLPDGSKLMNNYNKCFNLQQIRKNNIRYFIHDQQDLIYFAQNLRNLKSRRLRDECRYSLDAFQKFYPEKKLYIRAIPLTKWKRDETNRVFAEDVLDVIPVVLRQQSTPISKNDDRLAKYRKKWDTNDKDFEKTISLTEFWYILEEFNVDKSGITIIPDPVHEMICQKTIKDLRMLTLNVFSPRGEQVMRIEQAVFHIFEVVVCSLNWSRDSCKEHENCLKEFKDKVICSMRTYSGMDEGTYVTAEHVESVIKGLQNHCSFQLQSNTPSPLVELQKMKLDDTISKEKFISTCRKFGLTKFVSKTKVMDPLAKAYSVRIYYLSAWRNEFFDFQTLDLYHLILDETECRSFWQSETLGLDDAPNFRADDKKTNTTAAEKETPKNTNMGESMTPKKAVEISYDIQKTSAQKETPGVEKLSPDDAQKTSASLKASEVKTASSEDIQKTYLTEKLPTVDINQSKNCAKCLRTSELCNEAKKELKMTQNRLEKYEKKAKKAGEVEKELKALKLEVKKKEKEAEIRELELSKKDKDIEELKRNMLKLEAKDAKMTLAEKNHSISQNELLEKVTYLSDQLKNEKEKNESMELKLQQNEENLKSETREKERGFEELRAVLSIMSTEMESVRRDNQNLRNQIASTPEAPPTPPVPESPSEGQPTHHRFALFRFQRIKDSLYHKKQLTQAKEMAEKMKSCTNLVEIHQIADYEYYQFEGKLLKYIKEVELNIQKIKETCDVSMVTPLPDIPEFSQRFLNLYWRIINNQSITSSEIEVSDTECFICYVEMTSDQKTLQCEECKKVTHLECASKWLKIHRSCPHCRREMLDPEEFPNLGQ
ncbi:unnamed protein product [Caenorhabditis nigoni]